MRVRRFVLLVLLSAACTRPRGAEPSAEPELAGQGDPIAVAPEPELKPDRELEPKEEPALEAEPAPKPSAPEPARSRAKSDPPSMRLVIFDPEPMETCDWAVRAQGLPAISSDGSEIAAIVDGASRDDDHFYGEGFAILSASDGETIRRRPLLEFPSAPKAAECKALQKRIEKRIRELNRTVETYAPMSELDVVVRDDNLHDGHPPDPAQIVPPKSMPAAERPVQALYLHGAFVLRVPGVAVLAKLPKPKWRVRSKWCDTNPHIEAVFADHVTGVGAVVFNHDSGGHHCDDDAVIDVVKLPPQVFDELSKRPSAPYRDLVKEAG